MVKKQNLFDKADNNLSFCSIETLSKWIEQGVKCVWVIIPGEMTNVVPLLFKVCFFDFFYIVIIILFIVYSVPSNFITPNLTS